MFTNDEDKANLLHDYFQEQTIFYDDNVEVPIINEYNLVSRLNSIIWTADEEKNVLKSLLLGKTAGPDGVNNRVLKESAGVLSLPPLCEIFNLSYSVGDIPEQWKRSHITPVPKSGHLSLVSNYRPIVLYIRTRICENADIFIFVVFLTTEVLFSSTQGMCIISFLPVT